MSERRRSLAFTATLALLLVPGLVSEVGPAPRTPADIAMEASLHHADAEFVGQAPLPAAGLLSARAEGPPTPRGRATPAPPSALLEHLAVSAFGAASVRAAAARRVGTARADALIRAGVDAWHTTAAPPLRFT